MIFASIFHVPKAMPTGTDIYFVRILSCLNCSSFLFSKNELIFNRFFPLFHFNFSCFTHNCFLLTVWPKRLVSITSECISCFFAPKILNFAAYHTFVSFYSFSRFHVDFLFERFPIITGFPFSRAVSVKPNLINLVPFHPEEPKSYTFKF